MSIFPRLLTFALVLLEVGCASSQGVYHPVTEGQTLYRISRAYGVEPEYLARVNGIGDPTQLKVGQRLFVPGAARPKTVPATVSKKTTPAENQAKISPSSPAVVPKTPPPVASKAKVPTAKKAPHKGTFIAPVKGKIVKQFGEKSGQINRGIEYSVPFNSPILSAAAGRVIYSGNGIKGYGNLIILKHDESFYTVYGFNSKNIVPAGTYVSKGQKIALCGIPPGGGTPRLHFEIRHGKEAVNPIFYLP